MFPKCQNGGLSEKFKLKKPIIVVIDVRKTGWKFILIVSLIALFFHYNPNYYILILMPVIT